MRHYPATAYRVTAPVLNREEVIHGSLRERVFALEAEMLKEPQVHIEPVHRFAQGLYSREVTLPAGSLSTGHIHAQEHISVISKGRCKIVTEDGTQEIAAPFTMIVPPGRKNCVYAIEDTVWTTFHATPARTVEEAEATLIVAPEAVKWLS